MIADTIIAMAVPMVLMTIQTSFMSFRFSDTRLSFGRTGIGWITDVDGFRRTGCGILCFPYHTDLD